MDLFLIDQALCNKDGICAAECPMKIIDTSKGFPQPVKGAEAFCINCGHCVAVCPTQAFSHKNLSPEQCIPLDETTRFSPEQAEMFLRQRRSIRNYKKKPVAKDLLEKAITIAGHGPSGHNRQPVKWQVIHDTKEVKELTTHVIDWMRWMIKEQPDRAAPLHLDLVVSGWEAGMDTVTRNAPHLIIAHGDKRDPTAHAACTIAMTWLELTLPSLGLGGCWCGFFNAAATFWPPLQEALGLPKHHASFGTLMVGHPVYTYKRIPPRNVPDITWK